MKLFYFERMSCCQAMHSLKIFSIVYLHFINELLSELNLWFKRFFIVDFSLSLRYYICVIQYAGISDENV